MDFGEPTLTWARIVIDGTTFSIDLSFLNGSRSLLRSRDFKQTNRQTEYSSAKSLKFSLLLLPAQLRSSRFRRTFLKEGHGKSRVAEGLVSNRYSNPFWQLLIDYLSFLNTICPLLRHKIILENRAYPQTVTKNKCAWNLRILVHDTFRRCCLRRIK